MPKGICVEGSTIERVLNWHPARPGAYESKEVFSPVSASLPNAIAPIDIDIPIWDQLQLGSCTAHGSGAIWAYRMLKEGKGNIMPSRLFIYYCERTLENSVPDDAGAIVGDGLVAMQKWGVPPESLWPYDITQFAVQPPAAAYAAALQDVAIDFNSVKANETAIKTAVHAGYPVVFGFTVFNSFMSQQVATTGVMPMPTPNKGDYIVGGHCVVIVGYDNAGYFWCRNSWGNWGIKGRFKMPVENLKYCSDFYVLKTVK